jgi:3-hydroxymyristoyl/3-hydroxydecanoyl-(acyl carrier protein) dehydratase
MSATLEHETALQIGADHPSLPGHFPGAPLVPGVLLLDRVLSSAEQWRGCPLTLRALPQAKFLAPLLPDQPAVLRMQWRDDELRFTIAAGNATIAQGLMQFAQERRS